MYLDLPPGMDPNDPRAQRMLQSIIDQQFRGRMSGVPQKEVLENEDYSNMMKAQTAAVVADIRQVDAGLFLNALKEIRAALSNHAIGEGDKGSTERPPMDPAFDTVNRGRLEEAYLNVILRYTKYIDTVCERDFQFVPPKSLADKAVAMPAPEKKKKPKKSLNSNG